MNSRKVDPPRPNPLRRPIGRNPSGSRPLPSALVHARSEWLPQPIRFACFEGEIRSGGQGRGLGRSQLLVDGRRADSEFFAHLVDRPFEK